MPDADPRVPAASVVIPAYNEAAVLARCLRALEPALHPRADFRVEVVVVPNGCTDDTGDIAREAARRSPAIRVVELPEGSKIAALNAGDDDATVFPRIYLDADIELSPGALPAMVASLQTAAARVAAPRVRFDVDHADVFVRSFYRAFERLPYVRDGLIGLGVYGVSEQGRARFGRFPDVVADDLFVQRLFAPEERQIVDAEFRVRVPSDVGSLIRVRTRVARGNAQLTQEEDERFTSSTHGTLRALAGLVREQPSCALDAACYVAVTAIARILARRADRRAEPSTAWERDDSTRTPAPHEPGQTVPAARRGSARRRR